MCHGRFNLEPQGNKLAVVCLTCKLWVLVSALWVIDAFGRPPTVGEFASLGSAPCSTLLVSNLQLLRKTNSGGPEVADAAQFNQNRRVSVLQVALQAALHVAPQVALQLSLQVALQVAVAQ